MSANTFPEIIPQALPGDLLLRRMTDEFAADGVTPLYAATRDAPRATPTGRVLVRLDEGVRFDDRAASFVAAGYVAEGALSYAPHAGWVRAASGSVADGLSGLERLAALPGVRHVEPQLLYERALK